MHIGRHSLIALLLIGLAVATGSGCSSSDTETRQGPGGSSLHGGASVDATGIVDYEVLAALADPVEDTAAIRARHGIEFTFPKNLVAGRTIQGIWMSRDSSMTPWVQVTYGDDVLVHVWIRPTATDAESYMESDAQDQALAPLTKRVNLDGRRGFARAQVNIPPKLTEDGSPEAGTGISTGVSAVRFVDGRCNIEVTSTSLDVPQLIPFAKALKARDASK